MPTPRKTNPTPNGPVKKAPAKRVRKAASDKAPTQGIAAKRAQVRGEDAATLDPYAPTVWGADNAQGSLTDLELPSGQLVLAQRPGPEGLVAAGLLDDLDVLAGVMPRAGQPAAKKKVDPRALVKDSKGLAEAMKLVDRVVVHVVVKPELTPEPDQLTERQIGKIYPSSVGMEDKMFIFNWAVGGTRDLATFRQQLETNVESLADGEDVDNPAE